jgi:hypothetical protein
MSGRIQVGQGREITGIEFHRVLTILERQRELGVPGNYGADRSPSFLFDW